MQYQSFQGSWEIVLENDKVNLDKTRKQKGEEGANSCAKIFI